MRVAVLALALGGLVALAAGGALAQPQAPQEPTESQRQAAVAELATANGVGGCILTRMDAAARTATLTHFGLGKPGLPPEFQPAVAKVARRCTGRPFLATDRALANAALGAAKRSAVAIYFASELAIGQRKLDAVWDHAPDAETQPFVDAAKSMMDPTVPSRAPTLADAKPLAERLGIMTEDPGRLAPVHQYYMASALSQLAEAELAAQGVRPR